MTNEFLDMCNRCIDEMDIATVDRDDLAPNEYVDGDFEDDWTDGEEE